MFGKIKDKLKNMFSRAEEVIEEEPVKVIEKPKKEKKVEKKKVTDKPKKETKKEVQKEKVKEPKKKESVKKEKPQVEKKKEEKQVKETKVEKEEELDIEEKEEIEEKDIEKTIEKETQEKKGFFSKLFKKKEEKEEEPNVEDIKEEVEQEKEEDIEINKPQEKKGIFSRLTSKKLTQEDFDKIWIELEIFLLEINIAFEIVQSIEKKLKEEIVGNSFSRLKLTDKIREVLESEVEKVLVNREANFINEVKSHLKTGKPVKILLLGVNGTGKTTTIAKIVKYLRDNKLTSVVAAADTFRAAAIEQLEEHSKKLDFKLISHKGGSDPAAVAFDSIEHAKAKNLDVVLIDTAGRMPNNSNLMNELLKVRTVSQSQMAIFIGDSISGNDLIDQIELFNKGVKIDGVILTKVDTDEKPGSIVTTAYAIEKPIYFLGTGQTYDDLVIFNAKEIAKRLFDLEDEK